MGGWGVVDGTCSVFLRTRKKLWLSLELIVLGSDGGMGAVVGMQPNGAIRPDVWDLGEMETQMGALNSTVVVSEDLGC